MYYGRVDVYWPDGPIESYRLNKPTIAVGRSSGNDIVLDTTAISRYHITLTFNAHQVLLEDLDSVNGTYVDSVRLAAHDPRQLRGGEEIQIGDIRLIYHPPAEDTSISSRDDTTQRITLSQPTYRVQLDGPDMAVTPGAHVQAMLKIENLGDQDDRYYIEIEGVPKSWVRVDRVEMEVGAREQGQALISFKPLRRSESTPGERTFTVRVRSKINPAEVIEAPAKLHVLPFSGFGMALDQEKITASEPFKLYLHNQGSSSLALTLSGTDTQNDLIVQLPAPRLEMLPGERRTLSGTVQPRRSRLFGDDRELEFAVLARAHDPSGFLVAVPGNYVEKPLLPAWAPVLALPLIALVALLAVGLVLLLFRGDEPDPVQPSILAFAASSQSVTIGDTAQLTWDVVDAEQTVLSVQQGESVQVLESAPDVTSYTYQFNQTGQFIFVLETQNGDLSQSQNLVIEARPQLTLSLEVLGQTELVRNVQDEVRISWSVTGANEFDGAYNIWVESSAQPGVLIAAPLEAAGFRDVNVLPDDAQSEWLVTLNAEGQDAVIASLTQKLPIVFPSCELSAPQTVVRAGPGEAYASLGSPLINDTDGSIALSPLARDASSEWLQVNVDVGTPQVGWVPRSDFVCSNFDPGRLRISDEYPALPTPTLAPTATALPEVTPSPTASSPAPNASQRRVSPTPTPTEAG